MYGDDTQAAEQAWDLIFQREGRLFSDPFPRFPELVESYKKNNCRCILDLGCGSGRHVVGLAAEGFQVVGLDFSPAGLRLTSDWLSQAGLAAGLVHADMRAPFPFSDGTFDGLLSTQVIHHARLEEIRTAIGEIIRVLAPAGVGFVTVAARTHEDQEYEQIEPGTYVPLSGSEAGLPHHIFTEEEFCAEFCEVQILEVSLRAEGKVLTLLFRKMSS